MDNYILVYKDLKQKNKKKIKMPNYPLSKNTSAHKKIIKDDYNNKIKENENEQCHSQCIKLNNCIIKKSKTKIGLKNHFSERQTKIQHKTKLVENNFNLKDDLSPFNSISSQKYPNIKQNYLTKEKSTNGNLFKIKFSKIKLEKNKKKKEAYIKVSLQKEKNIEINRLNMTEQKISINKSEKNEEMIFISDNEDELLIINNEDKNENNFKVINTIFPKLSSNPFLTLNIDNNHLSDSNNSKVNNRNNNKIFFSSNNTRRKRCNKENILYNNNSSKTKAIISLNSSTSQNSNETKYINNYNLDLKTKKIKDLNSNIYIEGEAENEKNNNINQNEVNEENNDNLIIEEFLNLAKNGKYSEIFEKLRETKKNSINLNYKNKETGNSLLHFACQDNNIKLIKYLIDFNCDINAKNNKNQTPLHLASMKGNLKICKLLVENGALLNVYDLENYTPIHYACYNNFTELINYFFEIYIEIDTDEKSRYNFSKNKDISTLFHNYLRNKKLDISLLYFFDLNNEYLNQKDHTNITERKKDNKCKEKNSFQKSKPNSKNKNKEMKTKTLEINKNRNKVIDLNNERDKSQTKDLNSNHSLNISNDIINENSNFLKNSNKSKSKFKQKKYSKDSYKTISLKTKNLSNNILFKSLPFDFNKLNDSQLKNKENNNYNVVNETAYIDESHMNLKLNKINQKKKSKKAKKNINICLKKKDKNNTRYYDNPKQSKFHKKINLSHKKLNILQTEGKKEEKKKEKSQKQEKKSKYKKSKSGNKKKIDLNVKVISNEDCNASSQKIFNSSNKELQIQKQNRTLNNININLSNLSLNNSKNLVLENNLIKEKGKNKEKNKLEEKEKKKERENEKEKEKEREKEKEKEKEKEREKEKEIEKEKEKEKEKEIKKEKEIEKISTKSFICLALLGRGSFGEVYLVQKIDTKHNYAMKILRKERIMGQNLSKYALAERNILSLCDHPFIVKLNYAFQSATKLFLILEYCPGGDLAKHLNIEKKFEEERAKFYLCEVLLALEDLHKRNIIFRDLKPENIVFDSEGHCKLTDFGLSKEGIDNNNCTKSFCGSIAYLAPEVLKKQGHGKAVDWYLLGVLLYEMLTGTTPYYDRNRNILFNNIEQGKLVLPNFISENAKDLLRGLLQRNPQKRLGGGERDAEEIKEHIFFKDVDWDKVYKKQIKPPPILKLENISMIVFNKPKYFADENLYGEIFGDNSLQGWTFINQN